MQGGHTQPDDIYKPKEHGGVKQDGGEDKRTNPGHGFGGENNACACSECHILLRISGYVSRRDCKNGVGY